MRYRFREFELDSSRFALLRDGQTVAIEPKPLQLLLHLLERHPDTCSKDELLDALWPEAIVTEASLTRAVRAVRRALGEAADDGGVVRTVRGRGYGIGVELEVPPAATRDSADVAATTAAAVAPETQRRLAAILSTDAVGYSRLMGEDDVSTVRAMEAARAALTSSVEAHGGRVVDSVGDNLMAVFPSAVEAVTCALAAQREMAARAVPIARERQLHFRMGVHVGDLLVEGERVFGDGINVAARLEAQAPAGGLCVSDVVADQLRGKIGARFEDLGERLLKNLGRPIRVVRIETGVEAEALPADAPTTPESDTGGRPTLAVLPFLSLSQDEDTAILADGMTEDLTTLLAQTPGLIVIARTSTFAYKGRSLDVRTIGRELGARHVIEGSLRQLGGRLRATVQLIDALSGAHSWAEKYDRDTADLFALQDEVAEAIVARVAPEVVRAEVRRQANAAPDRLDAWALYQRALSLSTLGTETLAEQAEAEALANRALERDPSFSPARSLRAGMLGRLAATAIAAGADDAESLRDRALAEGERAVTESPDDAVIVRRWGVLQSQFYGPEAGLPIIERSLELNPNDLEARISLGIQLARAGRTSEAREQLTRAVKLSPKDPRLWGWHQILSNIAAQEGRWDDALAESGRVIALNPSFPAPWALRAAIHERAGRHDEARAAVDRLRELAPGISLTGIEVVIRAALPAADDLAREIGGLLRSAGLA